jgi:hypothetical protein
MCLLSRTIKIGVGATFDQRLTVARLTFEAFRDAGQILVRFLGGKHKAEAFVASFLREDRLLVASIDGVVVGFAGLEYLGKGFIDIDGRKAVRLFDLRGLMVYSGIASGCVV